MALLTFQNVTISALAAAVPKRVFNNLTDNPFFSQEDVTAIVEKTGVYQRRIVADGVCASDLCYHATKELLSRACIDPTEIDAMIFVSQTPDYRMPATSIILQHRLGLPKSCAAFDVNLGCSGFVVGLSMAYSLATNPSINKVLLLNGETRSKVYSIKDRRTAFLFGDAGSACLIEKRAGAPQSIFSICSDGEKSDYIKVNAGGYRVPSSCETVKERVYDDGSIRTEEQGYMDGYGVFEFVITEVPKQIKSLFSSAQLSKDMIDYYVFHQANRFMNDHLTRKLKLDNDIVPQCLDRYGNTSSVSIPLTMVSELKDDLNGSSKRILLSGFGVGLSLGSAIIELDNAMVCDLVEI